MRSALYQINFYFSYWSVNCSRNSNSNSDCNSDNFLFLKYFLIPNSYQRRSQEFDLGVYVLTSHCNFKTCVNVPHVNKYVFINMC